MSVNTKESPLVILALDTGDYEAIIEWTSQGYLPTIASIMQRGCWGKTAGPELICEYGLGLTMFSGISRAQHGYYYFRQLQGGTYNLQAVSPSAVDVPPFWNYLKQQDKEVIVVDVPDIYPVKGLSGLQLSNWATHHGSSELPSAEPPELLHEVQNIFGPRMTIRGKPDRDLKTDLAAYNQLLERVRKKGSLCRHFISRHNPDLVTIFFSDSDPASHYFWKYRQQADNGPLTHGIRDVYQEIDRQMGKILEPLPNDANVVILSLYGIQDEYPTSTLIESFCRELGYHVTRQSSGKKSLDLNPVSLARKIFPESVRLKLSHWLPKDTQEKLLADQLRQNTDWSRTTAFAIPSLFTSFVRVNLKGREPQGIVTPGEEYNAILARLEDDLKQLIDCHTGKPAVKQVSRTTELFQCAPHATLPDLFVEWQPGPRLMDKVKHPKATLIQPKPRHCPDSQEKLSGFIAAAGPAIPADGAVDDFDVLGLAPTFLSLLGQPKPEQMRGKILFHGAKAKV